LIGDKNMEKNNGKEKRARELFAKEVQEEKANKGWEYNRTLLEASIDSLVTIGPDGIITDVNSATEKATGIPRGKIIGTDFSEYFTEPDKARAGYKQVFDIGKVVDYELYLKHINGSSIPVSYNASVYKDNEGQIIGVLAVARDISAIKKYEDELIDFKNNLELVVQQKTAKLIIANKELAFQNDEKDKRAAELVLANRELAFQTGEKADRAAELVIADKELAFQTGEKADRAAELVIADKELAFQTGEKADRAAELINANRELIHQNEEKDKRAAELIIANKELVFQNEEKEKRAAELVIANEELLFQNEEKEKRAMELDIANKELFIEREKTEELNNQLESRVTERTAQLESVNKELEAFSYSVSHDLKAPLRHITGYISLLMKKHMNLLPEEGRRYLDNISSSAMNMGELIDGLLQFSRTGRIEMSQKLLDMNQIVDALIQPTRGQDQQHRIEFHINPLPPAFGDLEMIKSAWNNLIENAIKFSKKKDLAKISIGAEENETEIIYYIKDNGAGFDMNYAAKLFTVFQRLHSREDFEGTGIGLATVQKIIARHGGRIWAEGKVGEGAAFSFTLIKRKER